MIEAYLLCVVDVSFIVALLNRDTAKRREIHEIFESRLSRILLDFTEKSISQRDSLRRFLFFSFFRVILFPFVIQTTKVRDSFTIPLRLT